MAFFLLGCRIIVVAQLVPSFDMQMFCDIHESRKSISSSISVVLLRLLGYYNLHLTPFFIVKLVLSPPSHSVSPLKGMSFHDEQIVCRILIYSLSTAFNTSSLSSFEINSFLHFSVYRTWI